MVVRLDAYLAYGGLGSRSEVRVFVKKGLVTVDGVVCKKHASKVDEGQVVLCDGTLVELPPRSVDAVLYKPVGYACSHDPNEAPVVDDLLDPLWVRGGVQSAGRLDRETSGLLVLSLDGQFIHRLIKPGKEVFKRYCITYTGELKQQAVRACEEGLIIAGDLERPTRPARLILGETDEDGHGHATLEICEGRYHQVRQMITALGGQVIALHRDRIGAYTLPVDMEAGETVLLSESDKQDLLVAGLRAVEA